MCGIAGGFAVPALEPEQGQAALHRALQAIKHRGPDGQGIHQEQWCHLGMRRLAIIDVECGQQPIYNEDRTLAVVFNGEIYNYRELRAGLKARGHVFQTASDTEVLVHLFEERGPQMLSELRGMFAFCIHDLKNERVFLARDRFGKKPLYYMRPASGGLIFGSELKALRPLAQAAGERWKLNEQAIYDYLSLGVVPQPSTVFLGVYALEPGHWMMFGPGGIQTQRYWEPTFLPKLDLTYPEAMEQVRSLVGEATRLRLRSDVPLGVFLSGGVDSSVVALEAAREVGESLQTFTVNTGKGFDESPVARRTAAALGIHNEVLYIQPSPLAGLQRLVRQYDQPYSDSSAIPSLEISRLARERVKVVLNGDGGDEVFAGYRRYVAAVQSARFDWLPPAAAQAAARVLGPFAQQRRSPLGLAARFTRGLALSSVDRYLAWTGDMLREQDKQAVWQGGPVLSTEDRLAALQQPGLRALDQQLNLDTRMVLLSGLLVKMDMATMAHSLEARSPLLDHRLAEFAWRLPDSFRVRGGMPKAILRDAYREQLPDEVIQGAKRGFEIPLLDWLNGELRPLLMDTLGHPQALVKDYLDSAFVDSLLRHETLTERNWGYIIYALLVLELWLQEEKTRE
ncbi:asparagine synthase (glutamine-hydrolyzing) [Deinococcus fonticola]|uniref:asparagine synthase (glutamine-hydrolyzing) n=1 Tax=Deinococcus fonticola TaxID=2528713 RepID=UPI001074D6F0|nr:asparagine synthase (glutamine-hydrolyzing) [Deinococcus fonticola]